MTRSTASKSKASLRDRVVSSRDLATLAAELHLKGPETPDEIISRLISLMNRIKGKLASAAGENGRLRAVDIIKNVTYAIEDSKDDLGPFSGVTVTSNTSLLDVAHGTISRFKNLQTECNEAKAARNTAQEELKTLRAEYNRANKRIETVQASYGHSENARRALAERVEELAEILQLPEHGRSPEDIINFVVTLVADVNEANEKAKKDERFVAKSLDSAVQRQEYARQREAAAQTRLLDLQEEYNTVTSKLENMQNERQMNYEAVKHRLDSNQQERQKLDTIIDRFRAIWESILNAWDSCYNRGTEDFRNGVLQVWEHLYREIWSGNLPLASPAQVGLPAGDSRYAPWAVTNNFPNLDSGMKHDLSLSLDCIFNDAFNLRKELHDASCSAGISTTLLRLDQTLVAFPLVIVRSASGLRTSLGDENLLSIA